MRLVFDIETNGLLRELTTIHSLVIYDLDSNKYYSCTDNFYVPEDDSIETRTVKQGIEMLSKADVIIGHNIVKFDIPAIQKLYPDFTYNKARDTLLMAKLVYPDIGLIDDRLILKNQLPKAMRGRYSLESFGYRLKEYKGEYCHKEDAWDKWSYEMQTYCEQDVRVTVKLWNTLIKHGIPETTLDIEHEFATILFNQEMRGVHFDLDKAVDMASQLQAKKLELEQQLKDAFPDEVVEETFIPKVNNKNRGYVKGVPFVKRKIIEFNPSSRDMISQRLVKKYGWKPKHLSNTGKPILNEEIIDTLKYPEAPLLKEYFLVTKVLGQLLEGKNAWLKLYNKTTEAIHGSVDTIGAVTCRCTHKYPNLAQVPAVGGFMGKECRELFCAREGYNLVGCDASGLELRCLAHYMKDDEYTHEILNGDIHTKNQIAAGLPTRAEASDVANAIYDRTSAIMLSGECAQGDYPVECVKTMVKIANRIEPEINYWRRFDQNPNLDLSTYEQKVAYSACISAKVLEADAIVCYTNTGNTARILAGMGAGCPILAITDNKRTYQIIILELNLPNKYKYNNLTLDLRLIKENKKIIKYILRK